jgi:hypothetical protein
MPAVFRDDAFADEGCYLRTGRDVAFGRTMRVLGRDQPLTSLGSEEAEHWEFETPIDHFAG